MLGGVHLKGSPKLQDMPFDKAPKTPEGIFRGIEGAGKILKTTAFYKKPIFKKIENISRTIVKTVIFN